MPAVRSPRIPGWVLLGLAGSLLVGLDAFATSHLPHAVEGFVERTAGWLRRSPGRVVAHVGALVGSLALFVAWIALRPRADSRTPVLGVLALWCVPLLLAPPVMTADPFAYAAQGWLLSHGLDPYTVPMGFAGPYSRGVYSAWRPTTAVYPPFALRLQELVVLAAGGDPWWGVVGMRVVAVLGVAIIAGAVALLARDLGLRTRTALWAAVLNPLVVVQLVGGAHNDSIMVGLVLVALWLARRPRGLLWGSMAIGLAAMFKQPAVLAGIGVVLTSLPPALRAARPVRWGAIAARLAAGGAVGGAVFAGLSLLSGLGFGWLGTSAGSPSLVINHSPLSWAAQAARRLHVSEPTVDRWLNVVSAVLVLAALVWLARRFALSRPILFTAGTLLAFGLLGTAVQPWYVLWGGPVLAVAGLGPAAERAACAGVLLLLVSGALQGMPSPVVAVPLGAAVAYAWWRLAPSRRLGHDAAEVPERIPTG